ncbi:hypothetical protein GUITHDRAFT_118410 [Guillardia theta CCMP2712]|uniref:Uncharacterized protein n=1 Tax=Guillardia theta (strain CCMP2712) TaxID=905079 RepID=L1IHV7_GUITC|nr:hypothetical protein GUITHDRAFT_118410 [Guillardia theta CCMP2712]EKX35390.1 hypothetical protein GUITHDRAFT_118410 [Guillardia theta CCMP2712]|eukprot:XP_005822370.1 hypothetical protein GUITHDRAFT_118410 [Guillardia theta CCMP2712]
MPEMNEAHEAHTRLLKKLDDLAQRARMWRHVIPEIQQFFSSINTEMKSTMDYAARERNVKMKEQLLSRYNNISQVLSQLEESRYEDRSTTQISSCAVLCCAVLMQESICSTTAIRHVHWMFYESTSMHINLKMMDSRRQETHWREILFSLTDHSKKEKKKMGGRAKVSVPKLSDRLREMTRALLLELQASSSSLQLYGGRKKEQEQEQEKEKEKEKEKEQK